MDMKDIESCLFRFLHNRFYRFVKRFFRSYCIIKIHKNIYQKVITLSLSTIRLYKSTIPPLGQSLLSFFSLIFMHVSQAIIFALLEPKKWLTCSLILNCEVSLSYSTPSPIRKMFTVSPLPTAKFARRNAFQFVSVCFVDKTIVNFIKMPLSEKFCALFYSIYSYLVENGIRVLLVLSLLPIFVIHVSIVLYDNHYFLHNQLLQLIPSHGDKVLCPS